MINVIIADLPVAVKGFTKKHNDNFTIVLNAKHDKNTQTVTYIHEMKHIEKNDHEREDTISLETELVYEMEI